ncbi:Mss4-like protein [Annulohypoxylon bovei var. microspora]|nr:Mss4-like protein [Annulohypoxylon bovei var. microspora]
MAEKYPPRRYRANCHCAAYVYEVTLPESIKTGLKCDCSYCYKSGGIYQCPQSNGDIKFVKGDPATLSSYNFGDCRHQFCPNCGTHLFRINSKIYVNIRAFQNINVCNLDAKLIDGSTSPTWSPPKFTGREPPARIENSKVYTGGCHCGAITVALKSKLIDNTYDESLYECDCSICTRNAYLWIYPSKSQVTIEGTSNFRYYSFGRGIWKKPFCRTCGVSVYNHIDDYTPEQIAELPEGKRQWAVDHLDWSPINLRVLDGVKLGELRLRRIEGSKLGIPPYVNP